MRGNSFLEKATILAGLASNVDAFWRLPCRSRSGLARLDPLVNPGAIAQHAHAIHGSSGFGKSSGYDDLMAGNCTSCEVSQDKSAYWIPSLHFKNAATGKFEIVEQVGGMLAYYLLYGDNIKAFPEGFAMIAGNNELRNFSSYPVPDVDKSNWNQAPYNSQAFLRQAALGFNCLNYAAAAEGSLYRHFLPDKDYLDANCADGVRFELMFPSCWNSTAGPTAPDSKSHMAYPSEVMTGTCPEGFDTRLVSLFYETIWNTAAYKGIDGEFIISNGDPTGYGYHGDFIMGWEESFLQNAVDTCTNLSGEISDCPLFDIQDASVYGSCSFEMPADLVNDEINGPMATLPGNVPVQYGPGQASSDTPGEPTAVASSTSSAKGSSAAFTTTSPSAIVPTLSHSAGSTIVASLGETYVPGGVFAAVESGVSYSSSSSSTIATDGAAVTSSSTTVAGGYAAASSSPISAPGGVAAVSSSPTTLLTASSASAYSTSFSTTTALSNLNEDVEVDEVFWVEETVTVTTTAQAGVARRRHLHEHQRAKKRGNFA
ncbi:bdc05db1-fbf9-4a7b-826c-2364a3f825b4 [Sclerotinia trifoliorum]|uniref:Bdc05db1-fbf9-4a7b-826c-2364a3f825b4 n=1 Tax=Sclerotinia trifoliorum TaxID=28548 RepID=A0A8H2VX60_9HELO|nr:bdc05db1-fbf9-4a7b-826c-2364a3f825b4 [Sclerotinia trifoliorum]